MSNFDTLADRIRAEADQAARPGQLDRLSAIADEVDRLRQACADLGAGLVAWMELAKAATGSEELIDEDGDGDWAAVADRMTELASERNRA